MIQKYSHDEIKRQALDQKKQRAQRFIESGNLEQAIIEYNRMIFLYPDDSDLYQQRGNLYLELCDLSSAIANFRKSLKLHPSIQKEQQLQDLCGIKGLSLIDEGSVPTALDFLDQHMPADAQHSYLKSLGFLAMGEKVKALEELEHSVKLAPESSVDSLVLKGKILWSMNNEVEGNEAFWDAFSLSGNHPDVLEFVNIMRPLAEKWYDKATQAVLDDRLDQALYFLDKGLGVYKEAPKLLLLKAAIFRRKELYDEALDILERASKHMNFEHISEEVRIMIGLTYNDIGKALYKGASYDQAITGFNEAINFDGLNPGFFLNRGDCYRAKGQLETALADYHHAMELEAPQKDLNPRLGLLHHTLGIQLFNRQDYQGSLVEFSQCIHYCPNAAAFYVSRAKTSLQLLDAPGAFQDLKKAIEIDPDNEDAHSLLANFKQTYAPPKLPQKILKLMTK